MASASRMPALLDGGTLAPVFDGMPLLYEDQEEEMGESDFHSFMQDILRYGLRAHLASRPELRVFTNLNFYYTPRDPQANVGPDTMVVQPARVLQGDVSSYRLGADGLAPLLTAEILSPRTANEKDLDKKVKIYAQLGIAEYVLVDWSGRFVTQRLVLKRLQRKRRWKDEQDPDGGVTSRLGFRLLWDADGQLRVVNATTEERYLRPDEAQGAAEAQRRAEERIRRLEAELKQRRSGEKKPSKRRRKP